MKNDNSSGVVRSPGILRHLIEFIKYYPDILDGNICDQIVSELQEIDLNNDLVADSTRKNGDKDGMSFLYSININDKEHSSFFPYLVDAITKGKNRYLEEQPKYSRLYKFASGETYGIYEDIGNKLLIQYYPTGVNMSTHIDTGVRNYMKNNLKIDTEHCHSQLSCLLYLNDDYEGGEFVVADQEYKTTKGSIIFFPSSFMFPHMVNKVTKGERWSCAGWLR
jgi:hypothetical protein